MSIQVSSSRRSHAEAPGARGRSSASALRRFNTRWASAAVSSRSDPSDRTTQLCAISFRCSRLFMPAAVNASRMATTWSSRMGCSAGPALGTWSCGPMLNSVSVTMMRIPAKMIRALVNLVWLPHRPEHPTRPRRPGGHLRRLFQGSHHAALIGVALPAMSKAVPWSTEVRFTGRPTVMFTLASLPGTFTGPHTPGSISGPALSKETVLDRVRVAGARPDLRIRGVVADQEACRTTKPISDNVAGRTCPSKCGAFI